MKIGILTYHRVPNYGALLQAVATRVVLQNMGHEVYYVDYYPKYHKDRYRFFSLNKLNKFVSIKDKLCYLRDLIIHYPYKKKRKNNFERFIHKYIYPYCKPISEVYDIIVYGSDQIWRIQDELKSFNPIYFGFGLHTKKNISYAASMGITDLSESEKDLLKKLVSNLDIISVREEGLKQLLEEIGFTNITKVIDPTMLLTKEEWNEIVPSSGKTTRRYVLFYDLMNGSIDENLVKNFAANNNIEVIKIQGNANKKSTNNELTTVGPEVFIDLIRNAECVFTSSFHGLVFSIIYRKQFYAAFRRNVGRAESLLNSLHIYDRIIQPMCKELPQLESINYDIIEVYLNQLRFHSFDFLLRNTNGSK